jgi:hypothetical protein
VSEIVDELLKALRVQEQVWQSIRDRVEDVRNRRDNKGGQHVGVPEFVHLPPSALNTMDREAKFAIDAIRAALARYAERPPLRDDGALRTAVRLALPADAKLTSTLVVLDAIEAHLLGPREAGPAKG